MQSREQMILSIRSKLTFDNSKLFDKTNTRFSDDEIGAIYLSSNPDNTFIKIADNKG